ncbi:MAG TPA: aspartate/glutamate racemase family protein [Acetobacteraceae bacterium]|nr:aspartate/glutamate racemase family protein [Acetobacteraceae bacterium]
MSDARYRFLLINAFSLSEKAAYRMRAYTGRKEDMVLNHEVAAPLLADVEWDAHAGAPATHGDWPVETQEEFLSVGYNRLRVVQEACESGRYNAIVLLGGGDPGYLAAREIGKRHGVAVTSCAHAQMHLAFLLGHRFSILDISEVHNAQMVELVHQYRMTDRCASVRNVDVPLSRPANAGRPTIPDQKARHERGERSDMVEEAVAQSVAAIEEDGAEVIILGCSASYWLQPVLKRRLFDLGWDVPVLEGVKSAVAVARLLVDLGHTASGLMIPNDPPRAIRRRRRI